MTKKSEIKENLRFDESYIKLSKLREERISRKKLETFMKENPGLIISVSAEKARSAQKKMEKFLKTDPIGRQILEYNKELLKPPIERKGRIGKPTTKD